MRAWRSAPRPTRLHIRAPLGLRSLLVRGYLSSAGTREPDVRILEVGPRDGLQNIKAKVDTPVKIELIQRLAAAGCRAIEATSFVSPKWIPQLADSKEVMKAILPLAREKSFRFPVLTPNMKGFEGALQSQAQEAVVFASASEGFSWKNTNCSVEDALIKSEEVVAAALKNGIRARGYDIDNELLYSNSD